jgi:hypothetical protein
MNELDRLSIEYQQLKAEEEQLQQELAHLETYYPRRSNLQLVLGRESRPKYFDSMVQQMIYQEQLRERLLEIIDRQMQISMQIASRQLRESARRQSTQNQSNGCVIC